MIKAAALIGLFERMAEENWEYRLGAAQAGCVDCSGAFVYAYRALGGGNIEHSSNAMARRSVEELVPAAQAQPGWALFKWRAEGDGTPARWLDGRGDFYHVGLLAADGRALNAKGAREGFVRSAADGWDYAGKLSAVDYGEEGALYRAKVTTRRDPLRVRQTPADGRVIGHVPTGCAVDVLSDADAAWPRIRYGALTGYASASFLRRIEEEMDESEDEPEGGRTTLVRADGACVTLLGSWKVAKD